MKKYQPDTQKEIDDALPTPDELADAIIDDLLATVKTNGRIINRRILKDSILHGFTKLELATVADDDDTEANEQGAPVDPVVAREDILNAISNSIFESFEILNIPKKSLAAMVATNATLAATETFDKYFIR